MLALEILKHKWIAGNVIYDEDTDRHTRYLKYDDRLTEEAIKELEELENRSCEGCKYHLSDNGNYPLHPCGECSRFYSDNWESKC